MSLGKHHSVSLSDIHIEKDEEAWIRSHGLFCVGVVISGEDALNDFYKGYGDIPPFGTGPDQQMIHREGNAYIHRLYPKTDFILSCRVVEPIAAGHNLAEIPNILQPEDGHEHHELILGDFIERAAEDNAQAAPVTIEELAEVSCRFE